MDKDIKIAIMIIENKLNTKINTDHYKSVYLFSSENIVGITDSVELQNKTIMTVTSSGDHTFNMLLEDPQTIESYDINIFSNLYYYLKEAAIRVLSYEEFLTFFFPTVFKNRVFDDATFFRILPHIRDERAQRFWYILFIKYGGKKIYYSNIFMKNYYHKSTYMACNKYLHNEANYKKLQLKLQDHNHTFYHIDLFGDLTDFPNKQYDFIYLSNILDKYDCNSELELVRKTKQLIMKLKPHLTTNGTLGVCYLYFYLDDYLNSLDNRPLSSFDLRKTYFSENDEYLYKDFRGISNYNSGLVKDKDALMLVKKRNNS